MTQEANEECNRAMNDKANFINASGSNIRKIGKEALQTFFVLTKDPYGIERPLTLEEKKYFIHLDPEEITFEKLVEWFGNTVNIEDEGRSKDFTKSKFNPTDTLTISPAEYKLIKTPEPIKTTLGRLIFNKVLVEGLHFDHIFDFQNKVFLSKVYGGFDASIANALIKDEISVAQMKEYIDTRDWFGLQLHGIITTSFTPGVLKLPKSVNDLRKKLFEENKEALERGDEKVMEAIENQLLDLTKKELKDDIGMDLYNSGARGSVNNHLKNIMLTRGAVKNTVTGKYDIIEGSLMDGLQKKDITAHSNMIVAGAYPKSVGTQVSGYLAKELIAELQSEILGPKDSDCGSLGYLEVVIPKNTNDFVDRYIIEGNKLKVLSSDVIKSYIGKKVKMRSPMFCTRVGEKKCLCNKCAGDYYYKLNKENI